MSLVIEGIKAAWDHKEGIFDAAVIGSGAILGGGLAIKAFATEIPPTRVLVTVHRITRETAVLRDLAGNPRTGLAFRNPLERRKAIYTGVIKVDLDEVGADGEYQDITLRYPDGSESMNWRFDLKYGFKVVDEYADLLVRHIESMESTPAERRQLAGYNHGPHRGILLEVEKALSIHAATARVSVLTGRSTDEVIAPDGLEKLSEAVMQRFVQLINTEPWAQAIEVQGAWISDYNEPEEFRQRNESLQQVFVDTAKQEATIRLEALRLRELGQRHAGTLALASSGSRLNVFLTQGMGSEGVGNRMRVIGPGTPSKGVQELVDALQSAPNEDTAILKIGEIIQNNLPLQPVLDRMRSE